MHRHFPDGLLDHKTRNPSSCRIADLRKATHSQNAANTNLLQPLLVVSKASAGIRSTTNIPPESGFEEKSSSWVSTIRQESIRLRGLQGVWRVCDDEQTAWVVEDLFAALTCVRVLGVLENSNLLRKYARMGGSLACLAPGGPGGGVAVRERRRQGAEHRFGNPHALHPIPIGIKRVRQLAVSRDNVRVSPGRVRRTPRAGRRSF